MVLKYSALLFLITIAASCGQIENNNKNTTNKFFDINGLIDNQVNLLDSIGPFLLKKANINGVKEHNKIDTRSDFSWEKELSIFKSTDINKPVLNDSYEIITNTDSSSKTVIYISKTPAATQADSLFIHFDILEKGPIKIHAFISSKNMLYESAKTLDLTFQKIDKHSLISSYRIKGWQKMISKDTTTFLIEGILNF